MAYIQYGRHALRQIIKETNVQQSHDRLMQPLFYACQGIRYRKLDVILTTVSHFDPIIFFFSQFFVVSDCKISFTFAFASIF